MAKKIKIETWIPEKGYGFVHIGDERAFIHVTAIEPQQRRGSDLTGEKIVVLNTECSDKGLKVTKAITEEEWQQRQEIAEKQELWRKEADARRQTAEMVMQRFKEAYPMARIVSIKKVGDDKSLIIEPQDIVVHEYDLLSHLYDGCTEQQAYEYLEKYAVHGTALQPYPHEILGWRLTHRETVECCLDGIWVSVIMAGVDNPSTPTDAQKLVRAGKTFGPIHRVIANTCTFEKEIYHYKPREYRGENPAVLAVNNVSSLPRLVSIRDIGLIEDKTFVISEEVEFSWQYYVYTGQSHYKYYKTVVQSSHPISVEAAAKYCRQPASAFVKPIFGSTSSYVPESTDFSLDELKRYGAGR